MRAAKENSRMPQVVAAQRVSNRLQGAVESSCGILALLLLKSLTESESKKL